MLGSGADLGAGAPIERLGPSVVRRTRRYRTRPPGLFGVVSGYLPSLGTIRSHGIVFIAGPGEEHGSLDLGRPSWRRTRPATPVVDRLLTRSKGDGIWER